MTNNIPQVQLDQKQLDRLAAQRQIYSDTKNIQAIHIIASVPCVVAWSLWVVFFPEWRSYSALWGIIVTLLGIVVFNPWQNSLKQQAAKIQELFDCDVLQLRWSELKLGSPPDEETIVEASTKFRQKVPNYAPLENWYPVAVGNLPISLARIICQRTNCWWDAKLRRRYVQGIIIVIVILTALVFVLGLIGGLTLEKFILAVLLPLMPAFIWGFQHYFDNIQPSKGLERLKESIEKLWNKALAGQVTSKELEMKSREIQDEIYHYRCRTPLIFDWIYRLLRRTNEEQMNRSTEAFIEEATNKTTAWRKKLSS